MALARIITRSLEYSQQLALDLLARGYTVEIVSPDAIPKTPAELELRVEAGVGDRPLQVTEIGETKQGKSFEYLERLKPMVKDLLRRWPTREGSSSAETESGAFNFNAEQECSADVELPSIDYRSKPEPSPLNGEPEFEVAPLVSPPATRTPETAYSITGEPLGWEESEEQRDAGSEVWFWRAAVGFAGVALLILVFGMALRRNSATPAQPPAALAQNASAAAPALPASRTVPPAASLSTVPAQAAVIATATQANSNSSKPKPSPGISRSRPSESHEVVDRDTTVTYFHAKAPAPPKTVTAAPESGIKHYSDLN